MYCDVEFRSKLNVRKKLFEILKNSFLEGFSSPKLNQNVFRNCGVNFN